MTPAISGVVRKMKQNERRTAYLDETNEDWLRRLAFHKYWEALFLGDAALELLAMPDADEIVGRRSRWPEEVDKLLESLCYWSRIDDNVLQWLLSVLPGDSRSYRRLFLFRTVRDPVMDFEKKLKVVIDYLGQDEWDTVNAVGDLIKITNNEQLPGLRRTIRDAGFSERSWLELRYEIKERSKEIEAGSLQKHTMA